MFTLGATRPRSRGSATFPPGPRRYRSRIKAVFKLGFPPPDPYQMGPLFPACAEAAHVRIWPRPGHQPHLLSLGVDRPPRNHRRHHSLVSRLTIAILGVVLAAYFLLFTVSPLITQHW